MVKERPDVNPGTGQLTYYFCTRLLFQHPARKKKPSIHSTGHTCEAHEGVAGQAGAHVHGLGQVRLAEVVDREPICFFVLFVLFEEDIEQVEEKSYDCEPVLCGFVWCGVGHWGQ